MRLHRRELEEVRRYARTVCGHGGRFNVVALVADELLSDLKRRLPKDALVGDALTFAQVRRAVDLAYGAVAQLEDTK